MNPYVMMLLQRLGASSAGQRASDALERARLFEMARIPFSRSPATGRMLPTDAGQRIPLVPLSRGAAGLGAAGMVVADPTAPIRNAESLFAQLNERGAGAAPSAFSPEMRAQLDRSGEAPAREMGEPGYSGDAGRRLSGALLAGQPEPGYAGPGSAALAPPMPPSRPRDLPGAREIPLPPRRPEASRSSSRELWEIYNRSENPADFLRADQAMREGRASGGNVGGQKPHKDAALVKALEIIERLMSK